MRWTLVERWLPSQSAHQQQEMADVTLAGDDAFAESVAGANMAVDGGGMTDEDEIDLARATYILERGVIATSDATTALYLINFVTKGEYWFGALDVLLLLQTMRPLWSHDDPLAATTIRVMTLPRPNIAVPVALVLSLVTCRSFFETTTSQTYNIHTLYLQLRPHTITIITRIDNRHVTCKQPLLLLRPC